MSARYYTGGNGRRFLYQTQVTFRCPCAEGPPAWMEDALGASAEDAEEAGGRVSYPDLRRVFKYAHDYKARHALADPDDPTHCRACGTVLEKRGYYAWAEEPWPSDAELEREYKARGKREGWGAQQVDHELGLAQASRNINLRLNGPAGRRTVPGTGRYWEKKKDAIQWASEEAEVDRAAADEEA